MTLTVFTNLKFEKLSFSTDFSTFPMILFSKKFKQFKQFIETLNWGQTSALRDKQNDQEPRVKFINVIRAAFTRADPESVKFQLSHQYLFTLLGCTSVKAVLRMLMKLSPSAMGQCFSTGIEVQWSKSMVLKVWQWATHILQSQYQNTILYCCGVQQGYR